MSSLNCLWPQGPLMILQKHALSTGEKKYYILTTEPQHVLGLCAEGLKMPNSASPVSSSMCWKCGTLHHHHLTQSSSGYLCCAVAGSSCPQRLLCVSLGERSWQWWVMVASHTMWGHLTKCNMETQLIWQASKENAFPTEPPRRGARKGKEKPIPHCIPGPVWLTCIQLICSGSQRAVH